MSPTWILVCVAVYFVALLSIAWWTGRNADSAGYFLGNRQSPWWLIAFGLIGDTLSGVTFMSVPGEVGTKHFSYLQVVLGYVVGYWIIAEALLPLYYRLQLTSIYSFLGQRFGPITQRTGALFFVLSRTLGAAARLFLAVDVFQLFVFDQFGIPFAVTAATVIVLMLVYTYRGGIQTLVWTDLLQSIFLLLGLVLSIVAIGRAMDLNLVGMFQRVVQSPTSQVFVMDWRAPNYFWKQFISGALIAVVMTGLDQNSMQKNLSCRSLADARRNIHAFVPILVLVNLLFLSLGTLLHEFAQAKGIAMPDRTDRLFPTLALGHLGGFAALVFVLGLTAATFNSADSVLTTLTTSFCVDFLRMDVRTDLTEAGRAVRRHVAHISFAVLLLAVMLVFRALHKDSVLSAVLKYAGYTYGPLLGLFALGMFTRIQLRDGWVPVACVAAPVAALVIEQNSARWFGGYKMGFEVLLLNGLCTVLLVLIGWKRSGRDGVAG